MTRGFASATRLRLSALTTRRRAVQRAIQQAFPRLADFCLLHVVTPRNLTCVAAAHRLRDFTRDMRALISTHRVKRDDMVSTVACVARSCKPTLRTGIYHENDGTRNVVAQIHRRLAPTSALVVPVMRDGIILGALSLCYSHSRRSYKPQHLAPAERLAVRIANALTASHAASGLHAAARDTRQGPAIRRRLAARN